jgi:hypothetical protein
MRSRQTTAEIWILLVAAVFGTGPATASGIQGDNACLVSSCLLGA